MVGTKVNIAHKYENILVFWVPQLSEFCLVKFKIDYNE
jgi:hypothetical protein